MVKERIVDAIVIAAIVFLAEFLTGKVHDFEPGIMAIGLLVLIASLYLVPIVTKRFNNPAHGILKSTYYVETFFQGGEPCASIFRYNYRWLRGKWEIFGYMYKLRTSTGVLSLSRHIGWYSYDVHVERRLGKSDIYYFHEATNKNVTGITNLTIGDNASRFSGLFSDVVENKGSSDVTEFIAYRLGKTYCREDKRNDPKIAKLDALWKSGMRTVDAFDSRASKELLEYAVLDKDGLRRCVLNDAFFDDLDTFISTAKKSLGRDDIVQTGDGQEIVKRLNELVQRGYARYSNFRVAAAVVDSDGRTSYGVNVENGAYPAGSCAEQSAIAAMVANGGSSIHAVYLTSSPDSIVKPCGSCRQRIAEFAAPDCKVTTVIGAKAVETVRFDSLLPDRFVLP